MDRTGRAWLALVAALADRRSRAEAARALARELGAEDLLVFVHDPEVDSPLPALGFPQTLPEGRRWRDFVRRCLGAGGGEDRLPYPDAANVRRAVGLRCADAVLVVVGGSPRRQLLDDLSAILPLASAAFAAERAALVGETHASLARARARELEAMTSTLAEARASLQAALLEQRQLVRTRDDEARRKDEFLAILAHELRNPLAALAGAGAVLRQAVPAHDAAAAAAVVTRQAATLGRLVDDLLDLSRVTRGTLELRRTRVDLGGVAAHALETGRPLLEARAHRVVFEPAAGPLPVHGDPVRLEQIVLNLLSNAAHYTPRGGEVTLSSGARDGAAEVRVRDSGRGIPRDMLDRIFEIFTRAGEPSPAGVGGGLGIGLTVSRRLAEMHGGTLTASSEGEGRGSEFVLRIGLAEAAPDAPESPEPAPAPRERGRSRLRILVVDDNRDNADMTAALVEAWGHQVALAYDGDEALRRAAEFDPQVVLTDLGLPGLDGYAVAAALRSRPDPPRLIAMSGYGQEADRDRAREAGFEEHLVKPVDFGALERTLDALVP